MDDSSKSARPLPAVARYLLLVFAVVCVALGVIGIFIPGLPTTVFILMAGWAAARSSPRFHRWLENHRLFGQMLRDWRRHGAVSRRSKVAATVMMAACAVILFLTSTRMWLAETITAVMALVLMWLWLRPEPPGN
ncbi:YbaN family protein [Steroidobacter sp. S1-65]|uniref:Inner membrane protein n=1 Tax=Steroidobacter gossypii TaxID=2805490 RepID=A0ABS1X3Y4_9GAMM|nr:YbaN family protein [Steroidobacter gossypii]MBM0107920.1 YbaN family protein [Steroidobacter gossypii]